MSASLRLASARSPVRRALLLGALALIVGLRVLELPASNLLLGLALAAEATVALVLAAGLVRALRHPGETWERLRGELRTRLPAPLGEFVFTEVRLMVAAVAMVLRRPLRTPESSATVFVPMVESRSGWLLPVIAMATVMEGTAVHVLLYTLLPDSGWVRAVLLAVHAYGLLWLMGDRRLLWQSAHRLEAETLVLELGMRFSASIAYGKVTRVLPLRTDAERRSVQPRKGRGNPKVTPLDEPNVHLCLSEPVTYTTFFGLTRQTQHLDLFVERPEAFIVALTERMGRP